MPLPMMVPTTMAVAVGDAEDAQEIARLDAVRRFGPGRLWSWVVQEYHVAVPASDLIWRRRYSWGDNSSGSPITAILPLAS